MIIITYRLSHIHLSSYLHSDFVLFLVFSHYLFVTFQHNYSKNILAIESEGDTPAVFSLDAHRSFQLQAASRFFKKHTQAP